LSELRRLKLGLCTPGAASVGRNAAGAARGSVRRRARAAFARKQCEIAFCAGPKLNTVVERCAWTGLSGLRAAPATRRRIRRDSQGILCLGATIRVDGRSSAGCRTDGLSQTLQGFLPKPGLDSGIRRRSTRISGCLRSRAARPCNRREGVRLPGRGHHLLAALSGSAGDVFRRVLNSARKRRGPRSRFRCVGGFDGCVQREQRSLKLDRIENPLDALPRAFGTFQLSPQSVHTVSIRHTSPAAHRFACQPPSLDWPSQASRSR